MAKSSPRTTNTKFRRELNGLGRGLSEASQLYFDPNEVLLFHDPDAVPLELIRVLRGIGKLLTKKDLRGKLPKRVIEKIEFGEEPLGHGALKQDGKRPSSALRKGPAANTPRGMGKPGRTTTEWVVADILGAYFSDTRTVVIYDAMCVVASLSLGVPLRSLKRVVAAHEVSHAVTHLGKDKDGLAWRYFPYASKTDKELFAQAYPMFLFRERNNKASTKAFYQLCEYQDDIYNSWRKYKNTSISAVNLELRKARLLTVGPGAKKALELMDCMDALRNEIGTRVEKGTLDSTRIWLYTSMVKAFGEQIRIEHGRKSSDYWGERYAALRDHLDIVRKELAAARRGFSKKRPGR